MTSCTSDGASLPERLAAAEAVRQADLARRREERAAEAAPSESVEAFVGRFNARCTDVSARLTALATSGGEEGGTRAAEKVLNAMTAELQELERTVADAAYFLPPYDARASLSAAAALADKVQQVLLAGHSAAPNWRPCVFPVINGRWAEHVECSGGGWGAVQQMRAKLMPRQPFQFTSRAEFRATVTAAAAAPSTAAPTLAAPSAVQGPGLRGRTGGTVVLSAMELGGGEFVLEDLTEVTVWLCGPMRALFIHRLTNCRVYAGAVRGSMLLEDLQDCVVMVAAHQIRIHAAHRTDFYLRVRSNPIVEHCTDVRVAPYRMSYTGLRGHLESAGLDKETGLWDQVNDFGWLRASKSPHWNVLPEAERVASASMAVDGQADDDDNDDDAAAAGAVATSPLTSSVAPDDDRVADSESQSTASAIAGAMDAGGAAAVEQEQEEEEPDEI